MLFRNVRYALRGLWHSRGFAIVAISCLGFGIGLNTTIFSIVDGVLLKPFPYQDPDGIVNVAGVNHTIGASAAGLSRLDLQDLRAANKSFVAFGASSGRSLTISDPGAEPERYPGAAVSWDLFPLLGVSPALGHGFTQEDDRPGAGGVVLLSDVIWKTRYHSDPGVLGRTVLINAVPAVIIGVMPEGFQYPNNQKLWIPLEPLAATEPRSNRNELTMARLRPGVTMDLAREDVRAISARLAQQYPVSNEHWELGLMTLRQRFIPPDVSLVIWLMMAGVTLVLLIACSNVANLLLARASARRREFSVRTAIGAARGRLIRQLLTESVVLSLASVPLGLLLAEAGTRLIAAYMPPDQVPYYIHWEMDWRSLGYAVIVAVATAVVFGLFPALQMTRGNLHEHLKEGTRGNSARRSILRSTLVVIQVALALVALVGALLFVRTFQNLDNYNFGFDVRPLMTMRFALPGAPYEADDAKLRRVNDIVERVEALAGVQAAFASNYIPLSGGGGGGEVVIEGRPEQHGEQAQITFIAVTPHYHKTMNVPLVSGRDFTDAEGTSHTTVAVVNEAMARKFWPDANPLGSRFHMNYTGEAGSWFTVIGVARDTKLYGVDPEEIDSPTPAAFVPYAFQQTLTMGLTVRVAGDPASITSSVRDVLRAADPNVPLYQARTMDDQRRLNYWQYGLYGWIFGTIGVVGMLLAGIGLYGVLSYSVAQRTQEIGVRVALGAGRREVLRLIIGYGLLLAAIGVAAGLALAPVSTWLARSLLYNVSPFDPVTFAGVAVFLLVVATLASCLPAIRATRVDPLTALRGE
ncbi:MAG TPA: ABC transporter permease [Vicinamibacterales bacterium]|nr:ABC transporter permease [Vicinamibacterales bacterium]